jgi:hypothetical protein
MFILVPSAWAAEEPHIMTTQEAAQLAAKLLDYGMWRAEQDRNSFPTDFPREGEMYDPATGNKLANVTVIPMASMANSPRLVVTERIVPDPAPEPQVQAAADPEPDVCQGKGKHSYHLHGRQMWRCKR